MLKPLIFLKLKMAGATERFLNITTNMRAIGREMYIMDFLALVNNQYKSNRQRDIRGAYQKFPDFFLIGTFIDSTHMKL